MLIEEHKNGEAMIEIYDDYICSKEKSIEILQRVADNMLRYINAQENNLYDKPPNNNCNP